MTKIKSFFPESVGVFISLLFALVVTGGFSEFFSCLISLLTSVFLIIRISKSKRMAFRLNITSITVLLIFLFYLLSCFYAVDAGMAVIGLMKFSPVPLYMLLLMQYEKAKAELLDFLPYLCLALGIISFVLMWIPSSRFLVEGRLAGFFEYPNTFAMFLLIGELLCVSKEKLKPADIIISVLLFTLVAATMSRAVFVLALLSNFLILFLKKGKTIKIILGGIVIITAVLIAVLYPVLSVHPLFGRFLSLSVFESTFAGRLLYYTDALPVILRHPFGLGYLGYYYLEQSLQTGVYAVRFVHNDLLQLMLDVGWIPALGFLGAFGSAFFRKDFPLSKKIILGAFLLHILFDFDLQFSAMWMILLLFLNTDSGKETEIRKNRAYPVFLIGSLGIVCAYFSVALGLDFFMNPAASYSLYGANTQVKTELLILEEDADRQEVLADEILSSNDYVQIAYSAKAKKAYSEGDFEQLIRYKHKIFEIAPFAYDEYEEYAYMLISGIELYRQTGDRNSAEICREELLKIEERLLDLKDRLSYFGRIIDDQPTTELPDELKDTIRSYR